MRSLASLFLAIVVGIVAIWLLLKLLGLALKLVAIAIGIGLAVIAYLFVEKLVGQGR
ncbi:hypothetical protein PQ455_11705 [Sphingomonas naphthae]|uniref:Major facilitator superfamily (MFS) profile domain-containing protein n=1 Tax=Sphingomonas naphthae TaxID=1813468 RepID=A0ABY7TGE8_9SPHN|nr:hypothetical protein [Sphingomonas naphthae]WCT72302.1 hypothetical protein PQ455_11705 [Sphingomonas naphthae]